ncbi:amino acid ABC transporter permease [Gluconobacter cerinus]|uniref:amino acid ABC transporter permease n=1 Tax=Gluconobacter cerinus TaxID=38307 RepID=UPI001B8AC049|nr:ABC transporter permease subunit [Gluconobacter cerinus]MBS1026404.1 ABC transporter permease subunit [Gluconobacter cerinus]MBS1045365.1 ABC transporter permease subunit [Gluconobacter cerinus]
MNRLDFHPVLVRLPYLLGGVWITILIAALAFGLGLSLAVLLVVVRFENRGVWRRMSRGYSTALTNTPQLSQIFAVFYCLPLMGVMVSPVMSVVIGMTLNAGAYLADILGAGMSRVPSVYHEVALTLGLNRRQTYLRVILPHVGRTMFPALANHFQIMILGSAMASIFGVEDLTGRAYDIGSTTFRILEVMLVTGALYAVLSFALAGIFMLCRRGLERMV